MTFWQIVYAVMVMISFILYGANGDFSKRNLFKGIAIAGIIAFCLESLLRLI